MSDPCILIVEEDLLVRSPLAEYLRECGYLVLEASSAGDARTLLEDGSRRVDIVLAEVKSGDAAGFALASWVRTHCPTLKLFWPEQSRQPPKKLETSAKRDPRSPSLMTTVSCWTISNVSSPQGTGTIAPDAHLRATAT
jgi:CheY-like chemotaxis protein